MSETYRGRALRELQIEAVEWTEEAAEHIRTRVSRKGSPGELNIEPEWATQVALDPNRLVRPANAGGSLVVVGESTLAPRDEDGNVRVLKVWLVPKDLDSGAWYGASARRANESERKRYRLERR